MTERPTYDALVARVCELEAALSAHKRTEEALHSSEPAVCRKIATVTEHDGGMGALGLSDIIDAADMQAILDQLHGITGMCVGIADIKGDILASVGWRDVCSKFHRGHPETRKNCVESDTILASGAASGNFKLYRCKNNMWEAASPITIAGHHLGNIFFGQYFYDDEAVDVEHFRDQARRYGFDEEKYLAAVERVPRYSRNTAEYSIRFLTQLAQMISELSLSNLQFSKALADRKIAEDALRKSESRLKEAQTIAKLGNFEHDFQKNTVWWSDQVYEILGYPISDIPPNYERFSERLSDEDRVKLDTAVQRAEKYGEGYSLTINYPSPEDDLKYFDVNAQVVFGEDGAPKGLKGTVHDVTERKISEQKLIESESHLEILIDTVPDLIWLKDPDGFYLSCNPTFERFFGANEDSIVGKTDYDFVDKDLADFFRAHDRKAMELDKPSINEEWLTFSADGYHGLFETVKTPMKTPDGALIGVLGIARDITERETAEKEKYHLEKQLQQAQKMESIGKLAGGVAHDYNNELSVIIGFTELAMDDVDPAGPLRENLDEIFTAAKRAADITRQLLAFARKQTIAPKVIDLNENVEGLLKMLNRLIGEDIHLVWAPGKHLAPINMDPSQIDQILANLCVNARDAIPGVGKVTIESSNIVFNSDYCKDHPGFIPGEYVLLAVSDNGSGMEKEIVDKIFEPFFTTKGIDEGTGLGLATVYGIVKQNNGFINVYSEPGVGTTFKVYFHRHEGVVTEDDETPTDEFPQSRGETVLLVEDDLPLLKFTKRSLRGLGYEVLNAGTPTEAIRLAKNYAGKIHLLITDVVMPELNGRELSETLTSLCPDMKTVFMSGYTANVIAHHGVLDEGVHFVQKPFSRNDLAKTVRIALDEPRTGSASE